MYERDVTSDAIPAAQARGEPPADAQPQASAEDLTEAPLRRAARLVYWGAVAPIAARLPARLAYRVACAQGDWTFRNWHERDSSAAFLRETVGSGLSAQEVERLAQEFCRFRACEVIDVMLLRGRARTLSRLVEIRGKEHLEAALSGGRGAILCSAHLGSFLSACSLLHIGGFPLTTIGRWEWRYNSSVSRLERRIWDSIYAQRVHRHRRRPNIEPWPGRPQVAVQAAAALGNNEVVTISIDAPPLPADNARTIEVPFLGRMATLVPGIVTLAQVASAPVLMAFSHRLPDYRHQVLEISPPVSMEGTPEASFKRCVSAMETAIRAHPADWYFWYQPDNLARLGLIPAADADGG